MSVRPAQITLDVFDGSRGNISFFGASSDR
jgi:hypothetical protein